MIGPLPATARYRGRGTVASASGIEARFAETYDPTTDVAPEAVAAAGGDDWDDALEAVRDRVKWRAQGAERLRAAGFSADEIARWQSGRREVAWSRRGEDREWDRGKKGAAAADRDDSGGSGSDGEADAATGGEAVGRLL
jgi:hypothetical protein